MLFSFFKNRRRKKILGDPFPPSWIELIHQNVWQYRSLDDSQKQRVHDCTQVMVAEKNWEGIDGFKVTDEVRLTISATASLLTIGLDQTFYFDRVESILLHPGAIRNQKMHRGRVVDESEDIFLSGQAWQGGPLVFSWPSALQGSQQPGDGSNVVIHEFVHHIDGLDGEMGGSPIISDRELLSRWSSVFQRRYNELRDDLKDGRSVLIDEYAATNPAEFFAVAAESFFDSPRRLNRDLPDVYEVLKDYFAIDPVDFDTA